MMHAPPVMTPRLHGTREPGGDVTRMSLIAGEWLNDVGTNGECLSGRPRYYTACEWHWTRNSREAAKRLCRKFSCVADARCVHPVGGAIMRLRRRIVRP